MIEFYKEVFMKKMIAAAGLSLSLILSGCSVVEGFNQDPELAIFKKDVQPLVKAYIKDKTSNQDNLEEQLVKIFNKETGTGLVLRLCFERTGCFIENNIHDPLYDDNRRPWKISAEKIKMFDNFPKQVDYLKNKTIDNPKSQAAIKRLKMDYISEVYEEWKKIPDEDKLDKQKLKQLSNKSK